MVPAIPLPETQSKNLSTLQIVRHIFPFFYLNFQVFSLLVCVHRCPS